MKCPHCNGKPNVIEFRPNQPYDQYPDGASPYRGPTHCPFCVGGEVPDEEPPQLCCCKRWAASAKRPVYFHGPDACGVKEPPC